MTDSRKIRYAHQLIDDIANGYTPKPSDLETLRSFLPEMPKQKTLEDIIEDVRQVWGATAANAWPEDTHGILEVWLWELHNQLEGLTGTTPEASQASQASPKLPEGMRLASHPDFGLCVVAPTTDEDGDRRIFYLSDNVQTGADCRWVPVVHLSFLEEETPHPEFLEGEADYRNAPGGTIVACEDSSPWYKSGPEWSSVDFCGTKDNKGMSRARRRVLRWGK